MTLKSICIWHDNYVKGVHTPIHNYYCVNPPFTEPNYQLSSLVVYSDQQTSASRTVCWSKNCFFSINAEKNDFDQGTMFKVLIPWLKYTTLFLDLSSPTSETHCIFFWARLFRLLQFEARHVPGPWGAKVKKSKKVKKENLQCQLEMMTWQFLVLHQLPFPGPSFHSIGPYCFRI